MLIYGNTPRDIVRIFRINRWKLIAVIFIIATALLAYDKFTNQPVPKLEAMDAFWDAMGGKEFTKSKDQ
jgi:hypothetical protein